MQVERQDIDLVLIRVTSVELEELEATSLPNPYATANKRLRLLLDEGRIVLRSLPFGQVRGHEELSDELRRRKPISNAIIPTALGTSQT